MVNSKHCIKGADAYLCSGVEVVVQFYPWFNFYFSLFYAHYQTLPYNKSPCFLALVPRINSKYARRLPSYKPGGFWRPPRNLLNYLLTVVLQLYISPLSHLTC